MASWKPAASEKSHCWWSTLLARRQVKQKRVGSDMMTLYTSLAAPVCPVQESPARVVYNRQTILRHLWPETNRSNNNQMLSMVLVAEVCCGFARTR